MKQLSRKKNSTTKLGSNDLPCIKWEKLIWCIINTLLGKFLYFQYGAGAWCCFSDLAVFHYHLFFVHYLKQEKSPSCFLYSQANSQFWISKCSCACTHARALVCQGNTHLRETSTLNCRYNLKLAKSGYLRGLVTLLNRNVERKHFLFLWQLPT